MFRIVASFAMLSALAGCGYKGPLYMPAPAPPSAALTQPPTVTGGPGATPAASAAPAAQAVPVK